MYKGTKTFIVMIASTLVVVLTQPAFSVDCKKVCHKELWWGMNLPGSDYRNFTIPEVTNVDCYGNRRAAEAKECNKACYRDTNCRAWTYLYRGSGRSGKCYLKDRVPAPERKAMQVSNMYISGVKADKPPVQNESVIVGQIGVDRPGYDYRSFNLQRADARLCKQACDNERRCRAWAMTKPDRNNPQAHCWLKDRVPRQQPNSRVTSGIK